MEALDGAGDGTEVDLLANQGVVSFGVLFDFDSLLMGLEEVGAAITSLWSSRRWDETPSRG
jgi:hypothetical protein